jgi:protein involved in polysaccharide export with SLBB domain
MHTDNAARPILTGLACLILLSLSAGVAAADSLHAYAPWNEDISGQAASPSDHAELKPHRLSLEDITRFLGADADEPSASLSFEKPSPIETLYAERIIDELKQYGYDLFAATGTPSANMPAGTVTDTYKLGSGDVIALTIRGQENARQIVEIDAQGMLVADAFAPVLAAGKTINEVRRELIGQAAQTYNTDIFVSLNKVRQIGVLVIGDVKKPGLKTLTPFHTALDALALGGGINKTGSLRMIKRIRNGQTRFVDLYHVMMQGTGNADELLQDGDKIIVPPLGPTIAIAGAVKRPGIYEIKRGQKLSMNEMLGLAGGVLIPADNRFMRLASMQSGDEIIEAVSNGNARRFQDGDILQVARSEARRTSDITLAGETRKPGNHALAQAKSLSDLLGDARALGEDIYPLIGIIERLDPDTLTRTYLEFSPRKIIQKRDNLSLQQGDKVHLFANNDIVALQVKQDSVSAAGDLLTPISYSADRPASPETGRQSDPFLVSFLKERSVHVRGAVRRAGAYPVASDTSLGALLAAAGGLTVEAAKDNIELSLRRPEGIERLTVSMTHDDVSRITLHPGDTVRVNQAYQRVTDQSVTLLGEIKHPGKYDLMPGDTLRSLLERAGGLSEQAYPPGAIFSRKAERVAEEARYRAQAQDLEMKLAAALAQQDKDKKPDMTQVSATQSLVSQLKNAQAIGRITVEADPAILTFDPAQDILLETGDRIYIPKRPMTVRVAGEVLSPAALQFRQGKTPNDYIREAGGTTYFADSDRAFVILPDGSAKPLRISAWNHAPAFITPGSTIIVPRDPKPFNFMDGAERISQILANLAVTGLYIDAIGDD